MTQNEQPDGNAEERVPAPVIHRMINNRVQGHAYGSAWQYINDMERAFDQVAFPKQVCPEIPV